MGRYPVLAVPASFGFPGLFCTLSVFVRAAVQRPIGIQSVGFLKDGVGSFDLLRLSARKVG